MNYDKNIQTKLGFINNVTFYKNIPSDSWCGPPFPFHFPSFGWLKIRKDYNNNNQIVYEYSQSFLKKYLCSLELGNIHLVRNMSGLLRFICN